MTRFVSDQNQTILLYESGTYANTSGTGQWIGLVTEHDINTETNVQQVRYLGTASRNVGQHVDGPLDHEGTITFYPQDFKFLAFVLGSNVDAGSPSPYTHTISETNSNTGNAFTSGTLTPPFSFTIEDAQIVETSGTNFIRTLKGCVVDTLEVSASQGEIMTATATYVGQGLTFGSGVKTAVTESTLRPFRWDDIKVHIPSGTVLDQTKEVTLTINNNLERPHYLNGSRVISIPVPLNRDYEVALTLDGESTSTKALFDQYFAGGSQFNMMLEVNAVDAGAGSRDAFIVFSGCKLVDMEAPSTNEGVNEQSLTIVPTSASATVNDTIQKYNPW